MSYSLAIVGHLERYYKFHYTFAKFTIPLQLYCYHFLLPMLVKRKVRVYNCR